MSVTLAWILAALLGGVPYLIEGIFVNPIDSTFEAMSDFTTTGATLLPDIEATAKALLIVYATLTLAEVVALLLAGMNLYDAVLHAFTTIATGGFNPKNASVGFYDSIAIEVVIIVFMALSAVSFALYYLLYTQRDLKILLDRELLTYLGILVAAIAFVTGILVFEGDLRGRLAAGSQIRSFRRYERHYHYRIHHGGLR